MHTRFLPVLALALASTVGCSQKPPTLTTTPAQPDTQRQIAAVTDGEDAATLQTQATVEQNLGTPLSIQELPQRLTADQLVELPADQMKQIEIQSEDQTQAGDRSTQQWRGRGFGFRGYGGFGRGLGLRYYGYRNFYYPYYNYGSYYYPYAYYPYTYAYYPYSYYNYGYYPYYTPYYSYRSFYYPYGYGRFGYGGYGRGLGYGRFGYGGYGRRWR